MQINEHDSVVLAQAVPEFGLQCGDVGVVIAIYGNREGYEVEFLAGDGTTIGVVTLPAKAVRPLDSHEILHTRRIPA